MKFDCIVDHDQRSEQAAGLKTDRDSVLQFLLLMTNQPVL